MHDWQGMDEVSISFSEKEMFCPYCGDKCGPGPVVEPRTQQMTPAQVAMQKDGGQWAYVIEVDFERISDFAIVNEEQVWFKLADAKAEANRINGVANE